ncbi:LETM1 domain-containing protein ylh47 [Saitoella coloradoensis]
MATNSTAANRALIRSVPRLQAQFLRSPLQIRAYAVIANTAIGNRRPSLLKPAQGQDAVLRRPLEAGSSIILTRLQSTSSSPESNEKSSSEEKKETSKQVATKAEEKKLTLWEKVKHEAQHYWDGTKLLGAEIRISSKLALKMAAGHELSRRERRQLQRTTTDLVRLVPFSMFVIVPFAELLLPVALKLFPNMLPSTYEGQIAKEAKTAKLRETRKGVSEFLRATIRETGLPLSKSTKQSEEFKEFFRKVRTSGETPSQDDMIKVCQIFKDDLTLDNLSRPQLVAMCRYLNLHTLGTDNMLRYNIRHRMREIKRDDKAISFEGVESLSVPELQTACAARGIRTYGTSPARLRDELTQWLDLRLQHGVPSTLLVLSSAFSYNRDEPDSAYQALYATLSSLPDELFHEAELFVDTAEGAATNKQRLEVLHEQEELIEEENEQDEKSGPKEPLKDDEDLDEKEELRKAAEEASDAVEKLEGEDKTAAEKVSESPAATPEPAKKEAQN